MRRAIKYFQPQAWPGSHQATLTLIFDDRHKRRIRLYDDDGLPFLLDLPHATRLDDGGGLELEGGGFIRVCAAVEKVIDIQCQSPSHCAKVAWHIGNRHAAVQVLGDNRLRIAADHVLGQMLEGLGATLNEIEAPFAPEGGAYSGGHSHASGDEHGHSHEQGHGHSH
jgi:urease accessory protein